MRPNNIMTIDTCHCRPIRRNQHGIAAVELALTLFVLTLIGAGLAELGRAFWYYDALVKGTRDAARYLSTVPTSRLASAVTPTAETADIVINAANGAAVPGFTSANVSIVCAPTACASATVPGDVTRVTVAATYPLRIGAVFPFLPPDASGTGGWTATLSPHTTMPYMW